MVETRRVAFEEVTGIKVAAVIAARRSGDPAVLVASPVKIGRDLGWKPRADLGNIVRSAWQWHSKSRRPSRRT
jgi:UDP-glucose 4-epimerase